MRRAQAALVLSGPFFMIDETTERFPGDASPRLVLLQHGDEPVIEPGELYLRIVLPDGTARARELDELKARF
jgi:hypothetical protein